MTTTRMYAARTTVLRGALVCMLAGGCAHATPAVSTSSRVGDGRPASADSVGVGYGTVLRRDAIGGQRSIVVRPGERPGVSNVAQLLQGRVPGVEVRYLGAGEYSVRIRGMSSIVDDGEPLYVVDGIAAPAGGVRHAVLADINPDDVARIDVLRGAAAAVYGMRGGNGVILITTRRGRR